MTSEGTLNVLSTNWTPNMPTLHEVNKSMQNFSILDYTVFSAMLVAYGVVGVYFGFVKKSSGEDEYLVGGRNMKIIPVSFSLIASFTSSIIILSVPTEIYIYGISYLFLIGGFIFVGLITSNLYLPIFYDLKLISTCQYLEKRFDNKIRLLGSVLFCIYMITALPIIIYLPVLTFNQVTGVSMHIVTPIVCIVCIFYTFMGGLKAVVYMDFIQGFVIYGTMLLIIIKGTYDLGGPSLVIQRSLESGRIEFPSADLNPLMRHTIWAVVIGGGIHGLPLTAINQNIMQRFMSLPSLKSARRALWCFLVGAAFILIICVYAGLVIYAWYYDCDPLTTKLAYTKDQLVPLLVMDVLGDLPGLSGLFVLSVFSGAFSSLSSGLNSIAAVVLTDFVKPFIKRSFTDNAVDIILKLTVAVLGAICLALVFVVEKTGTHMLQLSISVNAITNGPILAIFSMGMLFPWINARGALIGGLVGLCFMGWLTFSAGVAIATGKIKFEEKPVTIEGCPYSFPQVENELLFMPPNSMLNDTNTEEPWAVYRLSYMWYTITGAFVTIVISLIATLITSEDVEKLDPMLLAPFVRRYLKTPERNVTTEKLDEIEVTKSDVKMASHANNEDDKLLQVTAT